MALSQLKTVLKRIEAEIKHYTASMTHVKQPNTNMYNVKIKAAVCIKILKTKYVNKQVSM